MTQIDTLRLDLPEGFDLHGSAPGPEREHGYPHLWPEDSLANVVRNGFLIGMTQSDDEAMDAARFIITTVRPRNILELGTCCGGWFYVMDRCCIDRGSVRVDASGALSVFGTNPGLRISVDRPWSERDPKPKWPADLFRSQVPSLYQVTGDIHDPEKLKEVEGIITNVVGNPRSIDLLYIDADHSYDGTMRHLSMYGRLVRPGGWIGFHDTRNGWPCGAVFLEMVRRGTNTAAEFYAGAERGGFGVGFVMMPYERPVSEKPRGSSALPMK